MPHATSIAKAIADNKFWEDVEPFEAKTERELCVKRLHWWINNMEGDLPQEAPMYAHQLSREVMEIIDRALLKCEKTQN